jgi:hypothetical protein
MRIRTTTSSEMCVRSIAEPSTSDLYGETHSSRRAIFRFQAGEGIAQRSRRPQRGWRLHGEGSLVDSLASGREKRASGKASHRGHGGHEGMEAAWKRFFGGQPGFWAGKRASAKASHRGHGGLRGGLKLDGGRFFDGQCGSGREKHSSGRHRTEVTDGAAGYATLFSV